jgi:hypothetical protein
MIRSSICGLVELGLKKREERGGAMNRRALFLWLVGMALAGFLTALGMMNVIDDFLQPLDPSAAMTKEDGGLRPEQE